MENVVAPPTNVVEQGKLTLHVGSWHPKQQPRSARVNSDVRHVMKTYQSDGRAANLHTNTNKRTATTNAQSVRVRSAHHRVRESNK
jgi:hypothetical protein